MYGVWKLIWASQPDIICSSFQKANIAIPKDYHKIGQLCSDMSLLNCSQAVVI